MSDELKERPIAFDTERPSQSEIDAAVAEITARLKAADAKDARIAELEAVAEAAAVWANTPAWRTEPDSLFAIEQSIVQALRAAGYLSD